MRLGNPAVDQHRYRTSMQTQKQHATNMTVCHKYESRVGIPCRFLFLSHMGKNFKTLRHCLMTLQLCTPVLPLDSICIVFILCSCDLNDLGFSCHTLPLVCGLRIWKHSVYHNQHVDAEEKSDTHTHTHIANDHLSGEPNYLYNLERTCVQPKININ